MNRHRHHRLAAAVFAAGVLFAGAARSAEPITIESLMKAGLVTRRRDGVKVLGVGELTASANFEVDAASKSAAAAIEKAGGILKTLRQEAAPSAAS